MQARINPLYFIDGIYFDNEFFAVWVANKTFSEQWFISEHEMCHHWVYYAEDHFCDNRKSEINNKTFVSNQNITIDWKKIGEFYDR